MDLVKTLLVYMMLLVGSAAEASPAITPPPAAQPAATVAPTYNVVVLPTARPTAIPTLVPTVVPTPRPTATPVVYTTLYVGDRGEEVTKLQRRLKELGYLTDKIDGVYGQNTKRAVERFQYYNDLKVDGIAGKATQRALYENPNVIYAPPDITPVPTPKPTPVVGVTVPVYYVDENGHLLNQTYSICYGTATIFANSDLVPKNYTLISPGTVTVVIRGGVPSPASVTFRYQYTPTPTQAPSVVSVPVYYMTDKGELLYQTSVNLTVGKISYVPVNATLVPTYYRLVSDASVAVNVNYQGIPTPSSVVFSFVNATPTPEPEAKLAQIPVRYFSESGQLLNETVVTVEYGQSLSVYASGGMVGSNYRLISQNPIVVIVDRNGNPTPAVVMFTYALIPTQAPPTQAPTLVPPTQAPTQEPTEAPTPNPTQAPEPDAPGITRMGSTITMNGQAFSVNWYKSQQGATVISLKHLCQSGGWGFTSIGTFDILGKSVTVSFDNVGVYQLTINGRSFLSNAFVTNGNLYVDMELLSVLGIRGHANGDTLDFTY